MNVPSDHIGMHVVEGSMREVCTHNSNIYKGAKKIEIRIWR